MDLSDRHAAWPPLSWERDHGTFDYLHLMTQIVGKIRVALEPWVNHSWHTPLYLSPRGLTTSLIHHPQAGFDLEFDFADHALYLRTAGGGGGHVALHPGSVAGFHKTVMDLLRTHGVPTAIHGVPNEIPGAVSFARDEVARPYDPDAAERLFRALLSLDRVFKVFRSGFIGKVSPVHFFWGSFDLAVTRFSGRRAPEHPGGVPRLPDDVAREAYSHEVSSAGFWTGGSAAPYPLVYAYAYPEPAGFREAKELPGNARFDAALGEYVLPYEDLTSAELPDAMLLDFLQKTYEAAADAGGWDRGALECAFGAPRKVREY